MQAAKIRFYEKKAKESWMQFVMKRNESQITKIYRIINQTGWYTSKFIYNLATCIKLNDTRTEI